MVELYIFVSMGFDDFDFSALYTVTPIEIFTMLLTEIVKKIELLEIYMLIKNYAWNLVFSSTF